MQTEIKPGTDLRLPAAQDMQRAATELASDALILGAGLRQITQDLREARDLIEDEPEAYGVGPGLALIEAVILTLTEAGY